MSDVETITLFHSPQTRSSGALTLLEELGASYKLHVLNMKAGEQETADYLAVNPLGKVPAILHKGRLVTEQVAIVIYLADLFPDAGLAPALGDADRGPYLRWLVYYAASYEPALVDKAMETGAASLSDVALRHVRHHARDVGGEARRTYFTQRQRRLGPVGVLD